MSRYASSPAETWDADVPKNEGFPYEFPFIFDRETNRNVVNPIETWGTEIDKTERYGVTTSETFTTPVPKTGRYGEQP